MTTTGIVGDKSIPTNRQVAEIKERTMTPTAAKLIRWAGLSAMVAGIIFAGIQLVINHHQFGTRVTHAARRPSIL